MNIKEWITSSKGKMIMGAVIGVLVIIIAVAIKKKKKSKDLPMDTPPQPNGQMQQLTQEVQTLKQQTQYLFQQIKLLSTPRLDPGQSGLMFQEKRMQQQQPQPMMQQQQQIPQDSPFSNLGGSMSAMSLDFGPNGGISLGK